MGDPESQEGHPDELNYLLSNSVHCAKFGGSFAPGARPEERVLPWYCRREYFVEGWDDPAIWRAALVEMVATSMIVFISGQISATIMSYDSSQIGAYVGVSNIILLSVFIYATSPASGGHMNPMITWATFWSGICPLSRGVLYILGQTLGSALTGGLLRGVFGMDRSLKYHGGGCTFDPSVVSIGQVFLNEVYSSATLLFLSFGVGLDPRQALLFGPTLGPLFVGMSLGLVSFASSGVAPGYSGAGMNPARCFAFAIARKDLEHNWIWWIGPAVGGLLQSLLYNLVPPFHAERGEAKQPIDDLPKLPVMQG
ncbi:aquaporin-like protein [Tothia fuscella]|uniref:Aquaporin-like protein n=1 Tax=Tothia fuscella TaxID=1048955 RepID=A0A9P4NQW3_9PEZI|nr:aquaporin-like protein [Tothia fuscella]